MVARDGIEPPTPAFSGPRSTTELSGLGISNAVSGIAKNHRAHRFPSTHVYCTNLFGGGMLPVGNQQRKRNLSIAIERLSRQLCVPRAILSQIPQRQGRPMLRPIASFSVSLLLFLAMSVSAQAPLLNRSLSSSWTQRPYRHLKSNVRSRAFTISKSRVRCNSTPFSSKCPKGADAAYAP